MKKILFFAVLLVTALYGSAQDKKYWRTLSESDTYKGKDPWGGHFKPAEYKLFGLQEDVLKAELVGTPSEKNTSVSKSEKIISVPAPDGTTQKFRIVEASVMEPALAARYPNIKSYAGQGIDNPASTIRCDFTPLGFHAMVTTIGKTTYYVNPLDKSNNVYVVNPRSDKDKSSFRCSLDGSVINSSGTGKVTTLSGNADDGMLRTFRLALCVTGEFSDYFLTGTETTHADSIASVMSAITAELTRANEVYERDFGIRLVFVAKEDTIIFLNPATDPYHSEFNHTTQVTCDNYIGNTNYDVGHVVHRAADNGNAGCIACVCRNGSKGSGFTMYSQPDLLDYFVIDYWTHEMGHQFGSNHTFTFSIEGSQAQVEPGSGITIMGYAGITGSTDIDAHSIDMFDAVSIAQNTNYIKTGYGSTCAVSTVTGDAAPVVNAGADYIIPKSTPFALKGTASDADGSDVLSYVWEQIDNWGPGSNTFPKAKSKDGPVFRDYNYSSSVTRVFPNLLSILDGTNANKWEVLPSVARVLDFRFTARDNHPGGGNNKSDDMKITISPGAGPFMVTTENTSVKWNGNETKTITWDVANSDAAPVNCTTVNILLSTDGGQTFSIPLALDVANDGTQDITVPNINTNFARIKVESVDNIFFDINDADFEIDATLPVTWLSFTAQKLNDVSVSLKWSTVNEQNNQYFDVERSTDGVNFTSFAKVNAGNHPAQVQQYGLNDYKAVAGINFYRLKQVDADGKFSYSAIAKVILPGDGAAWRMQPNPATSATTIFAVKALKNVTITLTNASGKTVFTDKRVQVNAGDQVIIPVSNFAKGIYFVHVNVDGNTSTQKLVVQ